MQTKHRLVALAALCTLATACNEDASPENAAGPTPPAQGVVDQGLAVVANINLDMPLLLLPPSDIIAFGAEHSSLESVIEEAITKDDERPTWNEGDFSGEKFGSR